MDKFETVARQNRHASISTLSSGELYLNSLNADLEATLRSAALRCELRQVAFSSGAGACQVRNFGEEESA